MTINDIRSGHRYQTDDAEVYVHETAARFVVLEYTDAESVHLRKSQGHSVKAKLYKASHDDMAFALLA